MGAQASKQIQKVELRVATLNYSGILKSPYEFYENQDDVEKNLSKSMKEAFDANKGKFQFEFGPFDRQWQQNRYSPLYLPTCGIKNNVHLMSRKEFQEEWARWRERHKQSLDNIYLQQKKKRMEKQKGSNLAQLKDANIYLDNLKYFDFLIYKTLLQEIYTSKQDQQQLKENFEKRPDKFQLSSKKYKQNRKQKFQKPFLNESKKIQMTIQAIEDLNLDILFLQQANVKLVQAMEQKKKTLRIVKSTIDDSDQLASQSVIVIRENPQKFPKFKSLIQENTRLTNNIIQLKNPNTKPEQLSAAQIKQLNFNSDTVVQLFYNIILICPHLTSKSEKNSQQVELLKNKLALLKFKFPDCHIIVAGDLNSNKISMFSASYQNNENYYFNVVPDTTKKHYTAHKKRTNLQAQQKKANQAIDQVKDYIISDLKIKQAFIQTVKGEIVFDCFIEGAAQQSKKMPLLPSESHPYDHYMLTATLIIENGIEHVTDAEYRYRYKPETLNLSEQQRITELQYNIERRRTQQNIRLQQMKDEYGRWVLLKKQQEAKRAKEGKGPSENGSKSIIS